MQNHGPWEYPLTDLAPLQATRTARSDFTFGSLSRPAPTRRNSAMKGITGLELDFCIHRQRAPTEQTNINQTPYSVSVPGCLLLAWRYEAASFQKVAAVGYALPHSSVCSGSA
jgi:hypothetical protein